MGRWSVVCAAAVLSLAASAATALAGSAPPPALERYVLGLLGRGPAWSAGRTPESDSIQAGHLANIRRMFASGKLAAAGPFADDGDRRGLLVFKVDSLDEIPPLVAADPAIQRGRLRLDLLPWYAPPGIGDAYRARAAREPGARDSMVSYSFVFLRRGPAWTANATGRVKRLLAGHARNIERLRSRGKLLLAGPFEGMGDLRGVFIFDADTAETRRLVATDPAVRAGRFAPEIHSWWTAWGILPGH